MKIAISVSDSEKQEGENSAYFKALVAAGAEPGELSVVTAADSRDFRAEDFDGVLFTGGEDVDPSFYDEKIKHENVHTNPERDQFEFSALERALQRGVPVFAICRGAQMVNVKFRGTLYQDLKIDAPSEIEHRQPGREHAHPVTITDADSRLGRVLQGSLAVNSRHHQGIHRVGHGLKVTAHAEDGLVEAFEKAGEGSYLLAVQWHPEDLTGQPEQMKLLQEFISVCRESESQRR